MFCMTQTDPAALAALAGLVRFLSGWGRPTTYTADPSRIVRRFTVEGVEGAFEASAVRGPGYAMSIYVPGYGHIGMAGWESWGEAARAVLAYDEQRTIPTPVLAVALDDVSDLARLADLVAAQD